MPVRSGDADGLGTVYSQWGGLICVHDESIVRVADGWEMEAACPWRRVLPGMIFLGFGGRVASKLYITTQRVVLIREIDAWRELRGEMTPLGLPKAAEKEARLKRLRASGARQYCEVRPGALRLVRKKKFTHPRSAIDLFLLGKDGKRYALTYWTPTGTDDETLNLLESTFGVATRKQ